MAKRHLPNVLMWRLTAVASQLVASARPDQVPHAAEALDGGNSNSLVVAQQLL